MPGPDRRDSPKLSGPTASCNFWTMSRICEYESFRLQFRSPALDRRIVQVKANWHSKMKRSASRATVGVCPVQSPSPNYAIPGLLSWVLERSVFTPQLPPGSLIIAIDPLQLRLNMNFRRDTVWLEVKSRALADSKGVCEWQTKAAVHQNQLQPVRPSPGRAR